MEMLKMIMLNMVVSSFNLQDQFYGALLYFRVFPQIHVEVSLHVGVLMKEDESLGETEACYYCHSGLESGPLSRSGAQAAVMTYCVWEESQVVQGKAFPSQRTPKVAAIHQNYVRALKFCFCSQQINIDIRLSKDR